jgi:aminoglycoside phosphotransferase (APT) family kinase protein
MTEVNLQAVLLQYGITAASATKISGGLINSTWKVTDGEAVYILQQINTHVFSDPYLIAANTQALQTHLRTIGSDYPLVAEIPTTSGELIVQEQGSHFRLLPFVRNSTTISVVATPEQAYQAAYQFGLFTKAFLTFDASRLNTTISQFHDLALRYAQFREAVGNGNRNRIAACKSEIQAINSHAYLVEEWQQFVANADAKQRVTHHDTKISNVLFDEAGRGLCVIDLDTVMPGYFFSDVGDMMRTYLSPANEEEADYSKLQVRPEFFQAVARGYLENLAKSLTAVELQSFVKSGLWLTYMQALRFLTDYFNDDRYYGARYEQQNLVRANNQLILLRELLAHKSDFQSFVIRNFT